MSARDFGFSVAYRPVAPELVTEPDSRPVSRLPVFSPKTQPTEAAREAAVVSECQRLEAQGYRVEQLERWHTCRACQGAGSIAVKPKGWRKKTAPPWYTMRRQACADCGGGGAEHIVESVQIPGAPA